MQCVSDTQCVKRYFPVVCAVVKSNPLLGCDPKHVYTDVNPIVFYGAYSQGCVYRIAAKVTMEKMNKG